MNVFERLGTLKNAKNDQERWSVEDIPGILDNLSKSWKDHFRVKLKFT